MNPLRPPRDPSAALLWHTRLRLSVVTMVMVTTLVLVVGTTTAVVATTLMRESIDRALDAAASDPLTLHELFEDEEEYEYTGPLTEADTFVMLVDAEGNVYGRTSDVIFPGLPDMAAVEDAAAGIDRRSGSYGGADLRLRTSSLGSVEIDDDDGATTTLFLQAGHDLSLQRELERQLLVAIGLTGLLGLAGAVLVTAFVTHRALIPIREAFDTERRFVATASHELRTPVSIIRASAEILQREVLVGADGRPLLDDIVGETERMGRLVGDLMALASAQTAAISMDLRAMDLWSWFEDVARRSTSMAETQALRLEVAATGHESGPQVRGDRDRLDQLLLILVDNALRHSPPGGTVHLSLAVEPDARRAVITVADEGSGVEPAELERIFEPFERAGSTRTSSDGAGLGLAIARQLAQRHDGELSVESVPGAGATFLLRLPLLVEQASPDRS